MKIETMLNEEIGSEFGELGNIAVGSDDYKTTVDGVTKLVDRAIKFKEIEIASLEKEREFEQKEKELTIKAEQLKEEKKDHLIKNILTAVSITLPVGVAIWGTTYTTKFETTGSYTTLLGRGWINKLIPKK